jgi:hypothetical protein
VDDTAAPPAKSTAHDADCADGKITFFHPGRLLKLSASLAASLGGWVQVAQLEVNLPAVVLCMLQRVNRGSRE